MRVSKMILLLILLSVSISLADDASRVTQEKTVITSLPELVLTGPPSLDFIGAQPGSLSLVDRMTHYGIPGVSLAVIDDYQLILARGYGQLDAETKAPVTPASLFEAASVTKFVTAVAVWQLVQRGDLTFDDEINQRLTSWRIPDNDFTANQPVTVRHLLSHTAGLNRPPGGFPYDGDDVPTLLQVLHGESPATNAPLTVEAEPGSGHAYSNFGYLVLQPLLEDLLDRSYPDLIHDLLCAPLEMNGSGFDPDVILAANGGETTTRPRARHHGPTGEPFPSGGKVNILAHGGLWTTPSDLARLLLAVLQGHQGRGPLVDCAITIQAALRPEVEFTPDQFYGYSGQGLGAFLLTTDNGLGLSHPGQNDPGATCIFIGFPATGQGAVVMTNGAQGMLLSLELLSAVASVFDWPRIICE